MLQVIITVITESKAQYNFTITGNVIIADRWEGETPSWMTPAQQRRLRNMPITRLPNIQLGRQMLIHRLGQESEPIVTTKVTDVSAISAYIPE